MTPGGQLRAARVAARLSQPKAADLAGVPLRTYQNWEIDHRTPPEYVLAGVLDKLRAVAVQG